MKIGIIGAGIAGLAAGKELALAGHEVTVIEKSRKLGGRLATDYSGGEGEMILDYGLSWLTAQSSEFRGLLAELLEEKIVKVWGDKVWQYDESQLKQVGPHEDGQVKYVASD